MTGWMARAGRGAEPRGREEGVVTLLCWFAGWLVVTAPLAVLVGKAIRAGRDR